MEVFMLLRSRVGLFQWKLKSMKDRVPVGCAVAKLGWCVRAKDAPFPSLSTQISPCWPGGAGEGRHASGPRAVRTLAGAGCLSAGKDPKRIFWPWIQQPGLERADRPGLSVRPGYLDG